VVTIKDLYAVAACPFQIPFGVGTKPQPCVTIRLAAATKVQVNLSPVLLVTPAALGYSAEQIPQGAPNSSGVQTKVIAT
jgi:hypothetical protein